jgi:hypothetical protein
MFKFARRVLVATVASASAGLFALTGTANASPVLLPPLVEVPTFMALDDLYSVLPADFKAGDCTQYADVSYVHMYQPDFNGFAEVQWTVQASTAHTTNAGRQDLQLDQVPPSAPQSRAVPAHHDGDLGSACADSP